jgi:hypothetical protein
MRGYKTRGSASRYKSGRTVPAHPSHPDRATRLVGLIAAGALGGLGGGLAVGFATVPGSGLSVAAAHHDFVAATTLGSGAPRSVVLTSSFSPGFVAPLPSPSPSPTDPNKPAPTKSPSATALPTPGEPNASAPLPTPTPTPTPTPSKSTGSGKSSGKGSGSGQGSSGGSGSGSGLGADAGSGGGDAPLVNVPGVSPQNPTGLFPTVSPGSGSNTGGRGKRIDAVTTAATTPLDTLIPGQVVGLAILIGAIALAFVRFSLRTPPPSDSQGKSQ